MLRIVIARIIRHAFMAGYEAALDNATQEMEGSHAFPNYEPHADDWQELDDKLSALQRRDTWKMRDILSYEIEVLRIAAGEDVPGFAWGAWVSACLGALQGMGLVTGSTNYIATPEGHAALAKWRAEQP